MTELLENSDNTNESDVISESPANEATISLAAVQALADALQKIEAYTPTVWVDNESPDIDAVHLNKAEQAIMRVTTAMNSAVDTIKDLQSQLNTTNNNLNNTSFKDQKDHIDVLMTLNGENAYLQISNKPNVGMSFFDKSWNQVWRTALKSDLFGELCTNPNTFTALIAMVNGYDSNISNVPDGAKKKFSIILNVWASPSDMGDLTKTHMQVLIISNGGGVVTRKYESNAWSNWQ